MDDLLFGQVSMTFGQVEHDLYLPDGQVSSETLVSTPGTERSQRMSKLQQQSHVIINFMFSCHMDNTTIVPTNVRL